MTATYIALEGPDGVGKSTVAEELKALLLHNPYAHVRIRHFPTQTLVQCAKEDGRALTAEDYMLDMENWLAFRPEPLLFPNSPTPTPRTKQPETLYILDRWALSTTVYARLRDEPILSRTQPTLGWLNRIPLTTFVLMPKTPDALTDPDYPDPDGYDPCRVTEEYRGFLANAFVSRFVPIVVDRDEDTPRSIAQTIAEWMEAL